MATRSAFRLSRQTPERRQPIGVPLRIHNSDRDLSGSASAPDFPGEFCGTAVIIEVLSFERPDYTLSRLQEIGEKTRCMNKPNS